MKTTCTNGFLVLKILQIRNTEVGYIAFNFSVTLFKLCLLAAYLTVPESQNQQL
jgi:hypothetical protein